ncbi:MAG: hypothetical protein GXP27_01725 [Planctomycetes bacterium]|nr:hypothetical protein [Planctomycetota bacterium]
MKVPWLSSPFRFNVANVWTKSELPILGPMGKGGQSKLARLAVVIACKHARFYA